MPTKRDGSGLTNAEQKIVRGFELAVRIKFREQSRPLGQVNSEALQTANTAYDRARAKLVALIRQNRPK